MSGSLVRTSPDELAPWHAAPAPAEPRSSRRRQAPRALLCALVLTAGCAGEEQRTTLDATLTAVEPACATNASATTVTIHGTLPVKPVVSLSSSNESTLETEYQAWLVQPAGEIALADVQWVDAATLTATVPPGIAPGVYTLTVESPFGDRCTLEGFWVLAGACGPGRAVLAVEAAAAAPAAVSPGERVIVTATVRNTGDATATGVGSEVLAPAGFTLFTSAADRLDIASGQSRSYTWTYTAEAAGRGTFAVAATGVDAGSQQPVSAPPVSTNEVVVAETGGGGVVVPTFTVGGSVAGLDVGGLVLRLNGGSDLAVPAGATAFTFPATLPGGSPYAVTIFAQPGGASCTLAGGSGTIGAADVTSVAVSCARTLESFTVGGAVSGLAGEGLVLRLNGGDDLPIGRDGTFAFPEVPDGSEYAVTVRTQPTGPSQTCTVARGTGVVSGADVTDVAVECATRTFTVGGSVFGLTDDRFTLRLEYGGASSSARLDRNGPFTFDADVPSGASYRVTVTDQPRRQTCRVTNSSGTVAAGNVTNVFVTCSRDGDDD